MTVTKNDHGIQVHDGKVLEASATNESSRMATHIEHQNLNKKTLEMALSPAENRMRAQGTTEENIMNAS